MANSFKIVKIFPEEEGTGAYGPWKSREVVVEEMNDAVQYPNQILLKLKGKTAEGFDLQEGDQVEFLYASRVSIYKVDKDTPDEKERGRMECMCWKIEKKEKDVLPFD